jgi:hypothetical protein
MRVTPITPEEADSGGAGEPFKPGEYDFTIRTAEETTSKAGNDMLKLTLHIFNRDGEKRTTFDYILSEQSGAWKARHMMESIGMTARYDAGVIDPTEIEGRSGRCKLGVEAATSQYPAKNRVQDYIAAKAGAATKPPVRQPAMADIDDEVPF